MDEMKLYQGTKTVRATATTRAVADSLLNRLSPEDADPNEPVYLVEYLDGGKPNLDGFEGYVSWSPADVFERSYRECGSHAQRMTIELDELSDRINKLTEFMLRSVEFEALSDTERVALRVQLNLMRSYQLVLRHRLDLTPPIPQGD